MPAFPLALALLTVLLTVPTFAQSVPPAGYGQPSGEYDITLSRVPIPQRPAAKALKPPFEPTPEILAEGKPGKFREPGCSRLSGSS